MRTIRLQDLSERLGISRERGQQQEPFLALLLLCLSLGIFLASSQMLPQTALWILFLLAGAIGGGLLFRQSRLTFLAFCLLFLLGGALRFMAADRLPADDISRAAGQEIFCRGILQGEPVVRQDAAGIYHVRYEVEAREVRSAASKRDSAQSASGHLYIYAQAMQKSHLPEARVGDEIRARGKVRLPHGYRNPGQIDIVRLLRAQGITASLATGKQGVKVVPQEGYAFQRWLVSVKQHYRTQMEEVMPREEAAAVFALLFGGYEGISPELVNDFTTTGIVHILSVSGSHISLLAAVMAWLGLMLHLPRWLRTVLVLGAILIYTMLAGCVPPVIRSAIMGGLAFTALALGWQSSARRILLITGIVMLLLWPLLLFHISFQLSFLATAGLVFLAPAISSWLSAHGLSRFFSEGLAITLSAHLTTLPVIAYVFNMFSVSSFAANLLIVPVIEVIIVLALAAGILAWVFAPLGKLAFGFASLLLGLTTEGTRFLARLPASQIYVPSPGVLCILLWYAGLAIFLLPAETRKGCFSFLRRHYRCGAGILLVGGAVWGVFLWLRPPEMEVTFLDCGQGDAAVIHIRHHFTHHYFMVDTGGTREQAFDVGGRVDAPYLLHIGARRLDAIFLSHAHEDHAAGAGSLLKKISVNEVLTAGEGKAVYAKSMGLSQADPLLNRLVTLHTGEVYEIGGASIEVLNAPEPSEKGRQTDRDNEVCDVLRIRFGNAAFLFTGDMEKAQEEALLKRQENMRAQVLKVGHHGSDTSTSRAFLSAVRPRFAVISVGADNSFGHPRPEVLERLQEAEVSVFRTDQDGAITFHTDGKTLWLESFVQGKISARKKAP